MQVCFIVSVVSLVSVLSKFGETWAFWLQNSGASFLGQISAMFNFTCQSFKIQEVVTIILMLNHIKHSYHIFYCFFWYLMVERDIWAFLSAFQSFQITSWERLNRLYTCVCSISFQHVVIPNIFVLVQYVYQFLTLQVLGFVHMMSFFVYHDNLMNHHHYINYHLLMLFFVFQPDIQQHHVFNIAFTSCFSQALHTSGKSEDLSEAMLVETWKKDMEVSHTPAMLANREYANRQQIIQHSDG